MPTNAEQRQAFLSEVSNLGADILALDLTTVWKKRRGNQPLLYGLRTHWQREQVTQAAPRALKAAVTAYCPQHRGRACTTHHPPSRHCR